MIHRDDMLELTRRMTLARHHFTRAAGAYFDKDGEFDGSFNTSFLKLSAKEKEKNLQIAKEIPFSETNKELVERKLKTGTSQEKEIVRLLEAINSCGLKNDSLLDIFYDLAAEQVKSHSPFAILLYHGEYDVPRKSAAGDYQDESEEVYSYTICAICPLKEEYEPDEPVQGFLYPGFSGRSADTSHIYLYNRSGFPALFPWT